VQLLWRCVWCVWCVVSSRNELWISDWERVNENRRGVSQNVVTELLPLASYVCFWASRPIIELWPSRLWNSTAKFSYSRSRADRFRNSRTLSGINPATFQPVMQCLVPSLQYGTAIAVHFMVRAVCGALWHCGTFRAPRWLSRCNVWMIDESRMDFC
jgi:hypothetical protein